MSGTLTTTRSAVSSYYTNFPQFSGVSDNTGFMGNENWNALEISLRHAPSHGFNMMINYTYSKSMDNLGTFRVGDNDRLDRSSPRQTCPRASWAPWSINCPLAADIGWAITSPTVNLQ